MKYIFIKSLLLTCAFSAMTVSVNAGSDESPKLVEKPASEGVSKTAPLKSGPTYLYNLPTGAPNPRIYHAFDMPYVNARMNVKATIDSGEGTPNIYDNLAAIAAKGYTHIQISPPNLTQPTNDDVFWAYGLQDSWSLAYKPYICVLSDGIINYESPPLSAAKKYLDDLQAAFTAAGSTVSLPTSITDSFKYGIPFTVGDGTKRVFGYRLGSDRYGSPAALGTLIHKAKTYGLGIIVDVVFHHVSSHLANYTGPLLYAADYVSPTSFQSAPTPGSTIAAPSCLGQYGFVHHDYPKSATDVGNSNNLTDFFVVDSNGKRSDKAQFGPVLKTSNTTVQTMCANYLHLLYDLGVAGIRIDDVADIGPDNLRGILSKGPSFTFGYGEDTSYASDNSASSFPLEDLRIQQQLFNVFGSYSSPVSSLCMPPALTTPAVTCSVNHDQYPYPSREMTGNWVAPFYSNNGKDPNNTRALSQSQLAIAYLCSRKEGSPLILRFEDERDNKTIIKRAMAFRTLMEQANAPQQYIVALPYTSDVLLIARGSGFAVINRNGTSSYTVTQDIIKKSNLPSSNSIGGSYDEISGLGALPSSGGAWSYTYSSLNLSLSSLPAVGPLNAKFFVKTGGVGSSAAIIFQAIWNKPASGTLSTASVYVIGNTSKLGNWSPTAANLLTAGTGSASSTWTSSPITFTNGTSFEYKFVLAPSAGGSVTKSETGSNRKYTVNGSFTVMANPQPLWS